MIAWRWVDTSLVRRRNSRRLTTIAILLRLISIRRRRMSEVTIVGTSVGLVRVFLDLSSRRLGKHRLSSLSVHVAHLHVIDLCILLLAVTAAGVPARHRGQRVFIERLARSIEMRILRFLLLLRTVHRCSGGLILCILRELRDGRGRLGVSLVAAMVIVAAGSAAGEAAAAAFHAAAEAANETPDY